MIISIVVAVGGNNAIGRDGDLLWRLPKDMQFFKATTIGHNVVMGRKTYESIPPKYRPLVGRVNIVVTRQDGYEAPGCRVVQSVDEAIEFAKANEEEELMVIGGGEIYRQMFDRADRIYLTKVKHHFDDADTFFPQLSPSRWHLAQSEAHSADDKHAYDFEFQILERV